MSQQRGTMMWGRSRSLLDAVVAESVDPSYAKAARVSRLSEQQEASGVHLGSHRVGGNVGRFGLVPSLMTGLALALLSVLIVVTVMQARHSQQPIVQTRQALEQEISRRQEVGQQLEQHRGEIQAQVDFLGRQIAPEGTSRAQSLHLRAATGVLGVKCSGVEVHLRDERQGSAPVGGPRSGGDAGPERLRDRHLQAVVNGLWAHGAQAVAINGNRLLSTSAIRQAGQAILVDYQPLRSPYVVRVCGQGQRLIQALDEGELGQALGRLQGQEALTMTITEHSSMILPSRAPQLRYARTEAAIRQ